MSAASDVRFLLLALIPLAAFANSENERYMAAIQFAVQANSFESLQRQQGIVRQQFAKTISISPELKGKPYDVRTLGNEVIFYFVGDSDLRNPVQQVLSVLIPSLVKQQVSTHGRSFLYRTPIANPLGQYKVEVDAKNPKMIRSVSVQHAPLRDLLKDIQRKVGTFSYILPSECGDRAVDFNFGQSEKTASKADGEEPKPVKEIMKDLAGVLGLKVNDENRGTYFKFSGDCSGGNRLRSLSPPEFARNNPFVPNNDSGRMNAQFFLPLPAVDSGF